MSTVNRHRHKPHANLNATLKPYLRDTLNLASPSLKATLSLALKATLNLAPAIRNTTRNLAVPEP